jgi:multimeric flavodoxin WrbA
MKVIAINSSPHMDEGNTAMILDAFLEGMKEAGADVALFYTRKLRIEPCRGDLSCWLKVPGECALKDDMQMLYPKFMDADVIVWGAPVYYLSIPGPLKNLIDRQMPLHVPGMKAPKKPKVVLVSTCAAWEISMFKLLLWWMKAMYGSAKEIVELGEIAGMEEVAEFAGALLRPHADCMRPMLETREGKKLVEDVLLAAGEAGRQLAQDGRISEEVLERVSGELMPRDAYYQAAREMFQLPER